MRKILCYDLHGADAGDYQDFYDYLEENYKAYRVNESVFVFFSDEENKTLKEEFLKHLGKDASFFVADLPSRVAVYGIENFESWRNK